MNKTLKKILKKIIPQSLYKYRPEVLNEKLLYIARSLGAHDLNLDISNAKLFLKNGGDYFPNYIFPQSWNEKIGYYISNYYRRSPIGMMMEHKYLAKKVSEKWVGSQYVVPTLGVWDKIEDIDWDKLPKSFVLKSCIGFQGKHVIIVHNKDTADKKKILKAMQKYISEQCRDFLHKKIIAEMLLLNPDGSMPYQFGFFCGRGNPLVCRVITCSVKYEMKSITENAACFYKIPEWQKLPIRYLSVSRQLSNDINVEKPQNLDEMIQVATKISSHFPLSRIDLYSIGEKVYIGEITTQPGGGFSPIVPSEWDFRLGQSVDFIPARELDKMIIYDKEIFSLDDIK